MPRPAAHPLATAAIAACAITTCANVAGAQPHAIEPGRLPAFGRSIAASDDTTALVSNPANLGFLPDFELRWQSVYLDESRRAPWQGHALSMGFPLFLSLATGLRLDLVDPPRGALQPGMPPNYQWLTWGLAVAPSRGFAIGLSLQRSYSNSAVTDDIGTYTVGATLRPSRYLAIATVARNVGGGLKGAALARLESLGVTDTSLGATITPGVAIRPLGTRTVELGLESAYLSAVDLWVPRATLGVDIPALGRVRGELTAVEPWSDSPSWMASAALALDFNDARGSFEAEAGALMGPRVGSASSVDLHTAFATRGFREPVGLGAAKRSLRLRLEETPGARGHVTMLRRLWELADNDEIEALVFELRAAPAGSLARVAELRDAVLALRRRGKRTYCHLESASGATLSFCAATDGTMINPAGSLRYAGMRTRHLYYRGLLDNLGIRADFVRIGPHKSAPESYTRTGSTPESRADKIDLLQQHERHFVQDLGADLDLEVGELRARLAKGPFTAQEAQAAGLVDRLAHADEIEKLTSTQLTDYHRASVAPESFATAKRVAVVHIEGDMVDGRSQIIPLLGMSLVGSYTIAETLKEVREDPGIAAVVLRVDSPGGSSMAAEVIWREVALTAKVKPTVVSMGAYAASGGYYVAAPATRIFANPLTITGSIGVFYGKADVSGLLRKIGVGVEVYKTAPQADAESIFRPFTPLEREELRKKIEHYYGIFLDRVASGRKMKKEEVDAVARGRVWTGEQAQARGLVDEIGGLRQALAYARRAAGLPRDADVVELPVIETSLIGRLLGFEGVSSQQPPAMLPPQLLDAARALAPFMVHSAEQPMMRLELEAPAP